MKAIFFALFLAITLLSAAQLGINSQWLWMKGDNTPDVPGVYGAQSIPATTNKPGARQRYLYNAAFSTASQNSVESYSKKNPCSKTPAHRACNPGNKGFITKEDAARVAKLVIKKINKNIMALSATSREL